MESRQKLRKACRRSFLAERRVRLEIRLHEVLSLQDLTPFHILGVRYLGFVIFDENSKNLTAIARFNS